MSLHCLSSQKQPLPLLHQQWVHQVSSPIRLQCQLQGHATRSCTRSPHMVLRRCREATRRCTDHPADLHLVPCNSVLQAQATLRLHHASPLTCA